MEIWSYERDKLYRAYSDSTWCEEHIITDMEEICDAIRSVKKSLQNGEQLEEKLIVLLGFENVCADFEFAMGQTSQKEMVVTITNEAAEMMQNATIDVSQEDEESKRRRQVFMEMQAKNSQDEEEDLEDLEDLEKQFEMLKRQAEEIMRNKTSEAVSADSQHDADDDVKSNEAKVENSEKGEPKKSDETKESKESEATGLYNAKEDLQFCMKQGSRRGVHFLAYFTSYMDLKQAGVKLEWFKHRLSFKQSSDDSKLLFNTNAAASLPEHICLYSDLLERFSFRPYLHKGVAWDGWGIDDEGNVINPMSSND